MHRAPAPMRGFPELQLRHKGVALRIEYHAAKSGDESRSAMKDGGAFQKNVPSIQGKTQRASRCSPGPTRDNASVAPSNFQSGSRSRTLALVRSGARIHPSEGDRVLISSRPRRHHLIKCTVSPGLETALIVGLITVSLRRAK